MQALKAKRTRPRKDNPREDDTQKAQQNPSPPPPPPPPRDDCRQDYYGDREGDDQGAQQNPKSTSVPPPGEAFGGRPAYTSGSEPIEYLDFRLQIGGGKTGGYAVEVQQAPGGRARSPIELPCDAEDVEIYLEGLRTQKDRSPEELAHEVDAQLGSRVFSALFSGEVLRSFESSESGMRGLAASGKKLGLRVRLVLGSPSQEASLDQDAALKEVLQRVGSQPWEYAYNPRKGGVLGRMALSDITPLVRSLDTPLFVSPLPVAPPRRLLLVDCVPTDRPLDSETECERLCAAIEEADVAQVTRLHNPTILQLREALREVNPHIFHFIGHGGFDHDRGDGHLCLFDDQGNPDRLRAGHLGQMLHDTPCLRLAFLNSCRTAQFPRKDHQDPWSATAAAILRAGIPAVLAMQLRISDSTAIEFSTGFYRVLAAGEPLEVAVAEGRKEIQDTSLPWEWGIPVLYLNTENGELFPPPAATAATVRDDATEPLKLGIRSFIGWGRGMKARVHQMLALDSYFDGRFIRSPELWAERVAPKLSRFLKRWVTGDRPVELEMAAHQTLAFLTGYLLEAKGGVRLSILQRTENEPQLWNANKGDVPNAPLWQRDEEHLGTLDGDVAVALGVTRPVVGDVRHYLQSQNLPIGRLVSLTLPRGPGQGVVNSGAHANALAQELSNLIDSRNPVEKGRPLHILGSAPNGFLVYLGAKAHGFGEILLYEYEFDKPGPKSYLPSLKLSPGKA